VPNQIHPDDLDGRLEPPTPLYQLRKRDAKYMQLEELSEFCNQARVEAGGEKNKEETLESKK